MLLKAAVSLVLFTASLGLRSVDLHHVLSNLHGVPDLDVFYTSDVEDAASFLRQWSDVREFGLYIRRGRDDKDDIGRRIHLLGICRGSRVLLFDLKPFLGKVPQTLPAPLASFLEHEGNTFYGSGLLKSAARLAFEFDVVIRCVDYSHRAWPELQRRLDRDLYRVADQVLGFGLRRPRNLDSLSSQAVHTYLQWALAHYFLMFHGAAAEDWVITKTDLYGAGPAYLHGPEPRHDWANARSAWVQRMLGRAAGAMRRTLRMFHEQGRLQQHHRRHRHLHGDDSRPGLIAPAPINVARPGRERPSGVSAQLAHEFAQEAGGAGEVRAEHAEHAEHEMKHTDWPAQVHSTPAEMRADHFKAWDRVDHLRQEFTMDSMEQALRPEHLKHLEWQAQLRSEFALAGGDGGGFELGSDPAPAALRAQRTRERSLSSTEGSTRASPDLQ